jgi:hypothetical protein
MVSIWTGPENFTCSVVLPSALNMPANVGHDIGSGERCQSRQLTSLMRVRSQPRIKS